MSERKERPTCQREDERLCIAPGRLSERKSSTTQSDNIYVHIVPSLRAESAERCVCGWQRRQPWKLDKTEAKVTPLRQCCGLLGGGEYDCVMISIRCSDWLGQQACGRAEWAVQVGAIKAGRQSFLPKVLPSLCVWSEKRVPVRVHNECDSSRFFPTGVCSGSNHMAPVSSYAVFVVPMKIEKLSERWVISVAAGG
ncbi:uncharacterized protein K489DRAFT_373052 [Dissoconium aciculare CBS 342.82]|uniref:Uncharacterized protein n=1 Tax=Dissoconium aciculare CBS 342.82 TaxID=1314786 RepID=A0A6J3LYV5_9PEZI|nr:uncharacterized protein K489DRAFT_373052 [Dissoconium aciculare CBS 342.82]KAF1819817.1 hypothetical protein K489DRAFT_373052 [Dissoconium aciculare CBS 342.82]